jgi:hypothetical protein
MYSEETMHSVMGPVFPDKLLHFPGYDKKILIPVKQACRSGLEHVPPPEE